MTKKEFIDTLNIELQKRKVKDIKEILNDYATHIDDAITSGISESQSVVSLGNIESIANDYGTYQKLHKNKRMYNIITSSYALPVLILIYATSILFMVSTFVSWSLGIYYIFQLSTFSFLPTIISGMHIVYGLLFISFSLFLFSVSIKFFSFAKSMFKQFYVKKDLRIGQYKTKNIYTKLMYISLLTTSVILILTFIVSVIITGQWEFWHYWRWFD